MIFVPWTKRRLTDSSKGSPGRAFDLDSLRSSRAYGWSAGLAWQTPDHDEREAGAMRALQMPLRFNDGFSHRGWTFEPRLSHTAWTGPQFALVLSASTLFADRTLNHLYYGVDSPDATADRPAYDAKAGLVATRLNASLRHRISSTLRLQYFAQVESVRGAANEDSPLVRSKQDAGLGVSLIWGAWHSAESGAE